MDLNRSIDELYYEKYDNVAVMFASLTDYKLGLESDEDLSDKFVLGILDEVISDFDRVSVIDVYYLRRCPLFLINKAFAFYG